jgi:Tfp pilus assembly protein PilN
MKAVNLIPSDQRRARPSGESTGKSAYVVLGLLGVLLVMAVAYVMTSNSANDSATKAAKAKQEANALEAKVSELDSYTDFASIKDQRLTAVRLAAETRFDWERLMREISRVMPAGSWLQTTAASTAGDPAAAAAPAAATTAVAAPIGPSATFVGCTPKQSEVAKILVRLRSMHRVTDVELNQSMREQEVAEVTTDSCGTLYKFDVTVTFAPADLAEAPRGSDSVPASLGGGS